MSDVAIMEYKTSSKDLYLVSCGWEKCGATHSYGPAVRNYYMLHFILQGQGHYYLNNKHYKLKANQCFLTVPGTVTLYKAEPTNPWIYTWICFNGDYVPHLLKQSNLNADNPIINLSCNQTIYEIIKEMLSYHQLTPANECYLQSKLYLIFAKLHEALQSVYNKVELNNSFYVTKAIEYIEKNTFTNLSVNDIARYLNISRSHLYALFKQELNTSPQQFLTNAKIANARELLSKTKIPIYSVALSCGYKNAFAFSRAFKQVTSISPREYRQHYLQPNDLVKY
ncbi:AraC family transcriptional regulator [uncultured Megamonas sp.]|uniref:AraC family transcriptional regulator n=1 Tax=uncultured Megamonas sp. TaxID=286140 RepID=UPI00266EFC2F|nr:AraC family transcriptional regulator [uncultured Megamonas sp.]